MNPSVDCLKLQIGSTLCVSQNAKCTKSVPVEKGTICYDVWTKNGLTEKQFYELNPGVDCMKLQIGSSLCINKGSVSLLSLYISYILALYKSYLMNMLIL